MKLSKEELEMLWDALRGKRVMGTDAYVTLCNKIIRELEREYANEATKV